jgi:MFS transporter, FSR family, fosmidomycin resistance protein
MPLIYPIITREFGVTDGQILSMVGIASAASGIMQLAFASLRHYVPRPILLGAGQLVVAVSSAITGFANTFNLFYATNVSARLGSSPQHPVGSSILSDHFETERRGFALAAHVSGGNVGTVLVPLLGGLLIATLGWRSTMFIFAAIAGLVGIMMVGFLNEPVLDTDSSTPSERTSFEQVKKIFANRNIMLIFIASTIAAGGRGLGVLITYIPLYLQKGLGLEFQYSNILFTILLIGSVIGPLFLGKTSDQQGRRNVLVITYLIAMGLMLFFTTVNGTSWLMPITLLALGIVAYAESPLLQAFLADSTEGLNRDLAFALYYTFAFGVGAFWAQVLGWVTDNYGYTIGFYVMSASYFAAALAVIPMRDLRKTANQ